MNCLRVFGVPGLSIKKKMEGPVDREECVYLAKLAEQAERYDEMVSMPWVSNRGVFTLQNKGGASKKKCPSLDSLGALIACDIRASIHAQNI